MHARIDARGAERIRKRLERLANPEREVMDLMNHWGTVLIEDNRRRQLAGLDCNDEPMTPTLREMSLTQLHKQLRGLQTKLKIATGTGKRMRKEMLAGFSQELKDTRRWRSVFRKAREKEFVALADQATARIKRRREAAIPRQNEAEKRVGQIKREIARREQSPRLAQGTGPPLAPNREASRTINLFKLLKPTKTGVHSWLLEGGWHGFLDRKGRHILTHHRLGIPSRRGKIVRDITSHPTPTAVRRATLALRDWARQLVRRP